MRNQHTSLHDVIAMLRQNCSYVVKDYLDYKTHVCRQVYQTDPDELEEQLDKHETAWPEDKESKCLTAIPAYLQ